MLILISALRQRDIVSVMGDWYFRWGDHGRHPCGSDAELGDTADKKESTPRRIWDKCSRWDGNCKGTKKKAKGAWKKSAKSLQKSGSRSLRDRGGQIMETLVGSKEFASSWKL